MTGELLMASTKQKVHDIIHDASVASAAIDPGSTQDPESVSEAILPIQTSMIIAIASAHGIEITSSDAVDLLRTLSSTMRSRQVPFSRQALAGWVPGIENVNNDSMSAALTEAIGWAANSHFGQTATNMKG
jgi:uncharacterized protein (DUF697 family)